MDKLSQWDLKYLDKNEQAEAIGFKQQWGNDPSQRDSLHAALEGIRAKKGYSGGVDGSQYIPMEQFAPPTAPDFPQWESPYEDEVKGLFNDIKNQPDYESQYGDLLNQQISNLMNRPKFDYDPENDAAYQAFKERAGRAGDKAYSDNLAGLSAMTGGRANSWAGTVASQARNEFILQAEEAVIHFEDRAYSRYRDETTDMYNLVNLLDSQDEKAYSRFRDSMTDKKDLADLVLKLEDREFEQFRYSAEVEQLKFETEYNSYKDSLTFKKDQITEAMERTNLNGYVGNKDSIVLGVPTGTLSQTARERAEQMEDYIRKAEIDLEFEKKIMDRRKADDKELFLFKDGINRKNAKSYSSSGGQVGTDGKPMNLTKADGTTRDKLSNEFTKFTSSRDYLKLPKEGQREYVETFIKDVIKDSDSGLYGKNSIWIGSQILDTVESSKAYKDYEKYGDFMADYTSNPDKKLYVDPKELFNIHLNK